MPRPEFVTPQDIMRWSVIIDNDPALPKEYANNSVIREVCLAGLWLCDELEKLGCSPDIIVRIQWAGGRLSFGRDTWEVHQKLLEDYKNNLLKFAPDPNVN